MDRILIIVDYLLLFEFYPWHFYNIFSYNILLILLWPITPNLLKKKSTHPWICPLSYITVLDYYLSNWLNSRRIERWIDCNGLQGLKSIFEFKFLQGVGGHYWTGHETDAKILLPGLIRSLIIHCEASSLCFIHSAYLSVHVIKLYRYILYPCNYSM